LLFELFRRAVKERRPNAIVINYVQDCYLYYLVLLKSLIKSQFYFFSDNLIGVKEGLVILNDKIGNNQLVKKISGVPIERYKA
jgi:hypothetical protein